jgi:hypothetical protein
LPAKYEAYFEDVFALEVNNGGHVKPDSIIPKIHNLLF